MKRYIQYTFHIMLLIISVTANSTAVYHIVDGTVAYSAELVADRNEEISNVRFTL